jgi:hypothetical protein
LFYLINKDFYLREDKQSFFYIKYICFDAMIDVWLRDFFIQVMKNTLNSFTVLN